MGPQDEMVYLRARSPGLGAASLAAEDGCKIPSKGVQKRLLATQAKG